MLSWEIRGPSKGGSWPLQGCQSALLNRVLAVQGEGLKKMAFSFLFWLLRIRTSGREWKLRFGTSQVVSAGQEAEVDEQ